MGKLRLSEVVQHAPGHTASKWQDKYSYSRLCFQTFQTVKLGMMMLRGGRWTLIILSLKVFLLHFISTPKDVFQWKCFKPKLLTWVFEFFLSFLLKYFFRFCCLHFKLVAHMTMVNILRVIFFLNHSSPIILKAKLSFLETYTSARISTLIRLKPSVREKILGITGSFCSPGNLKHLEDGRGPTVPLDNISEGWKLGDLKAKAPCKCSAHYRCYNIWFLS